MSTLARIMSIALSDISLVNTSGTSFGPGSRKRSLKRGRKRSRKRKSNVIVVLVASSVLGTQCIPWSYKKFVVVVVPAVMDACQGGLDIPSVHPPRSARRSVSMQ